MNKRFLDLATSVDCHGLYCVSIVRRYSDPKRWWGINCISTIKLTLNCTQQVDFAVQKAPFNCHLSKQILNWFAFFALVMSAMFLWHVFRVLFFFWNFWFKCFSSEFKAKHTWQKDQGKMPVTIAGFAPNLFRVP